jgi:hypothetical protein
VKKISEAALMRGILRVEAERLKHPTAFQPDRRQRATLARGRRRSEEMVSAFLKEAGLDLGKFQALQEQRSADLERMVEQHKAEAVQRAAMSKDTLYSTITAQTEAWQDLASRKNIVPFLTFVLDTPFTVRGIPQRPITDFGKDPFGNFAKFKFAMPEGIAPPQLGRQKFSFLFYWTNPSNDYAVINADTFMSAVGHLEAHAPWTWGTNASEVTAHAVLNLWFGWPTDVTSMPSELHFLGRAAALSSSIIGSDSDGTAIGSFVDLHASTFAVPPGSVVVFEVALLVEFRNAGGNIEADFESGSFRIICPSVIVSLWNIPPLVPT